MNVLNAVYSTVCFKKYDFFCFIYYYGQKEAVGATRPCGSVQAQEEEDGKKSPHRLFYTHKSQPVYEKKGKAGAIQRTEFWADYLNLRSGLEGSRIFRGIL